MKNWKLYLFFCFVASFFLFKPFNLMYREQRIRRGSYEYAKSCIPYPNAVRFRDIKVKITYGDRLYVYEEGGDIVLAQTLSRVPASMMDSTIVAAGFYSVSDSTIYIPEAHRYNPQVLAHEYIHALGIMGHRSPIFEQCEVAAHQIQYSP